MTNYFHTAKIRHQLPTSYSQTFKKLGIGIELYYCTEEASHKIQGQLFYNYVPI